MGKVFQQTVKLLLKFAILLIIESLRTNPEEYNIVLYDIPNRNVTSYSSKYLSSMGSGRQHRLSFNNNYTVLIVEESEKHYNKLTTELTNNVITTAASSMALPLLSLGNNTNSQKLA